MNEACIASASSAANLSESSLSLLRSKLESEPSASPFTFLSASFASAFCLLICRFSSYFLSRYSLRTLSRISYSSITCLYYAGSYPFHWSRFASQPRSTWTRTSSRPIFLPVNLAPTFLGRSMQVFAVWVRAPQLVQAPLRNLVDVTLAFGAETRPLL